MLHLKHFYGYIVQKLFRCVHYHRMLASTDENMPDALILSYLPLSGDAFAQPYIFRPNANG